jgi:hypothetical protein
MQSTTTLLLPIVTCFPPHLQDGVRPAIPSQAALLPGYASPDDPTPPQLTSQAHTRVRLTLIHPTHTDNIACISESTSQGISDSDDPSSLHRAIYVARSHLALSPPQAKEASSAIQPFTSTPAGKATDAFIRYISGSGGEGAVDELRDVVIELEGGEDEGNQKVEEGIVRTLAGTVFILEGENEEAVATLTEGAAKTDIEW